MMERYRSAAVGLLLGGFVLLRYHDALGGFWIFDDLFILRTAIQQRPLDFFISPAAWQTVNLRSFTPLMSVSYAADYSLFGFRPAGFYGHHLLMLWLSSVALFLLLRKYTDWRLAGAGALLFLGCAPAAAAAYTLMVRHYVEGLLFCLLSLLFFVSAVRRESWRFSLLSAACFFLAVAAKEIYVPFGLLVLALPEGDIRTRLRHAAPLLAVLAFTFWWRTMMMGDPVGGPGGAAAVLSVSNAAGLIMRLPREAAASVCIFAGAGPGQALGWAVLAVLAALHALALIVLIARKRYAPAAAVLFLAAGAYSVPLLASRLASAEGDFFLSRMVFSVSALLAATTVLSAGVLVEGAWAAGRPRAGKVAGLVLCFLVVVLVLAGSARWLGGQRQRLLAPLWAEGEFFMKHGEGAVMVTSIPVSSPPHFYRNLEYFKRTLYGEGGPLVTAGPYIFPEAPDILSKGTEGVFAYDRAAGGMRDIRDDFLKQQAAFLSRVGPLPLSVELKTGGGAVSYSFGPSAGGRYFLLLGYRPGLYPMVLDSPRKFADRGAAAAQFYLRVGWESPEGRLAFSPEWHIDFSADRQIVWERK